MKRTWFLVSTHDLRRMALFVFLATCVTATHANASTMTVDSTSAQACGCLLNNQGAQGLLFALDTQSLLGTTGEAIADVAGGHLGALASTPSAGGFGGVDAFVTMSLDFSDTTPDDFLIMDMSLHGTYTDGGGRVDFLVLSPYVANAASILCSSYNDQHYGVSCTPGNKAQAVIPLDGIDSLTLQWFLTVSTLTSGTTNFFNSADFSITVPDGMVIQNDPGGSLFHKSAAISPVPEPATLLLFGTGLVGCRLASRRRRWLAERR